MEKTNRPLVCDSVAALVLDRPVETESQKNKNELEMKEKMKVELSAEAAPGTSTTTKTQDLASGSVEANVAGAWEMVVAELTEMGPNPKWE